MLDVVSVLLGFISVAQNVKNKKDLKERVNAVKGAIDKADAFYSLLKDAKQVHDVFDNVNGVALQDLLNIVENEDSLPREVGEHFQTFKTHVKKFISPIRDLEDVKTSDASTSLEGVPVDIRDNVKGVLHAYPRMKSSFEAFQKLVSELDMCHAKKNYGDDFRNRVAAVEDEVREICTKSDEAILNSAPILGFIHYAVKDMVQEI